MFPITFLALLLSGVVECGRRPTDPNASSACSSRAEMAAASQHYGGQASEGPGEDLRPALGTARGATSQPGRPLSRHRKQQPGQRWWL